MTESAPKVFISYSWSSPAHEDWVMRLAKELRENGVDVTLDKWDLKEGQDADAFMERMVTDASITKVLMICDRTYAAKADKRTGGVGTEAQIITPTLYRSSEQTKFIAVLPELDEEGKPCVPAFYGNRVFVNLSDQARYAREFDKLLRAIFGKPEHEKPPLGARPAFLAEDEQVSLGATTHLRRAGSAVRDASNNAGGAVRESLREVSRNLERFRIEYSGDEFDEALMNSIEEFTPSRDEVLDLVQDICRYRPTTDFWKLIHGFFESLLPYYSAPVGASQWHEVSFDNFRFVVHELLLHVVAIMLRERCFDGASFLLSRPYYSAPHGGGGKAGMVSYTVFRQHLKALEHRKRRLKSNKLSLHASILKQRCEHGLVTFDELMQADFVLFLRDEVDQMKAGNYGCWWPVTLVYAEMRYNPFELFARAESQAFLAEIEPLVGTKEQLQSLVVEWENTTQRQRRLPTWEFHVLPAPTLMGHSKLGTIA